MRSRSLVTVLATHTESHTSFWSRRADQARLNCSAAPVLNLRAPDAWVKLACTGWSHTAP